MCNLKQSLFFGNFSDINLQNENKNLSYCKTHKFNILRIAFRLDIYLHLQFSLFLPVSSHSFNKTANGVPLDTEHSFY
jgi:hypothetical protein